MVHECFEVLINELQNLTRKMVLHFLSIMLKNIFSTNMFNVQLGYCKFLLEYLDRFNEKSIKVANSNHEMFVGAF